MGCGNCLRYSRHAYAVSTKYSPCPDLCRSLILGALGICINAAAYPYLKVMSTIDQSISKLRIVNMALVRESRTKFSDVGTSLYRLRMERKVVCDRYKFRYFHVEINAA